MGYWWFGANMAGQRNKSAFKFLLQLLILSQKAYSGCKESGLGWFRCGLGWFGGGFGCFGVVWGVSTDPQFCDDPKKISTKFSYPKNYLFF